MHSEPQLQAGPCHLGNKIINCFFSCKTDTVGILYTKFVSLITSTPSVHTRVPFSASKIFAEGDEVFQLTSSGGNFGVELASSLHGCGVDLMGATKTFIVTKIVGL